MGKKGKYFVCFFQIDADFYKFDDTVDKNHILVAGFYCFIDHPNNIVNLNEKQI